MSVWNKYSKEQKDEYSKFLQAYCALSNLFRQKKGDLVPYLDSKFQETVYAKVFQSELVDMGNTPHDILSILDNERIGIGLKTWMWSKPSYQKVMQLKSCKKEIDKHSKNVEDLANTLSSFKNQRMQMDYKRLGLNENSNIYHYVTRDKGLLTLNECAYPLVDIKHLKKFKNTKSSFLWSDGNKDYKYTYGDSQIWQRFDSEKYSTTVIDQIKIKIIDDPFSFLLESYSNLIKKPAKNKNEIYEIYLPLYSFKSKEVEEKSGLNAWNAAPKCKDSETPRPINEVYIPIPREFHKKHPDFFTKNISEFEKQKNAYTGNKKNKPEIRFHLQLPNGKKIPALVTQSNMKGLQSGSNIEKDENGKRYGQSALGQWLLVDVLALKDRTLVTHDWLKQKGTDSVRLWRKKDDYSLIYIDFAPIDSFENFMNNEENQEEY